jgi:hypothetical protein
MFPLFMMTPLDGAALLIPADMYAIKRSTMLLTGPMDV